MYRINCIAIALALTVGRAVAQIPPIGTDTGDGFKVAARWAFHYRSKAMTDDRTLGGPMRSLDAPLNYEKLVTGEADVTEEVNKSTGEIRAVIKDGRWSIRVLGLHYTDKYGTRIDAGSDAEDSGKFKHAAIGYGYDEKLKKPTVHFAISSEDSTEKRLFKVPYHPLDEEFNKVTVSGKTDTKDFNSGVSGGCDVPFKQSYLYYRKRTPEDGSSIPYTEIVIERTPREIEAEIKPADDYEFWVPTLDGTATFEARIVNPPGLRADEWQFSLADVSVLPGVCNNANIPDDLDAAWQWQLNNYSPDLIFDFRHYGQIDTNFKPVRTPWTQLHTANATAGVSVAVSCLDWGGYGRISAKASVDGHWVEAKWRKTDEAFIRIPWSLTDEPSSHIARHAKTAGGQEKYFGRDIKEDADKTPAGAPSCDGDGLTVFQEYRGFYVRDANGKFLAAAAPVFQRLDPDKKDVFIFMDETTAYFLAPYLADFQNASGLAVHRIGGPEDWLRIDPKNRYANFNRSPIDKPQCALLLSQEAIPEDGAIGDTSPHSGPPRRVEIVKVDYAKCRDAQALWGLGNFAQHTTVHELGHAIGIHHHGETDVQKKAMTAMEGGQHSGNDDCAMKYVTATFFLHKRSFAELNPTPQPYDSFHDHMGLSFCTDKRGTGRNDKKKAGWYCGDADLGNCAGQILINDQCVNSKDGETAMRVVSNPSPDQAPSVDRNKRSQPVVSAELNVQSKQIVAGEPVVIELRIVPLSPNDAAKQKILGRPGHRWIDEVTLKVVDANHKQLPTKCHPIGSVEKLSADPTTASKTASPEQLQLEAGALYTAKFAIDGTDTAQLSGDVIITASLPFSEGPVQSSGAALNIKKPQDLPAEERDHIDVSHALAEARLAFAAEKFADAETLARQVITKQPDGFEAHLILARCLVKQEKLKEAYDEFGRALELRRPPKNAVDEPPYEIIFEMQRIAAKLGIKPEPPKIDEPLARHDLFATTAGARAVPPFSKSAEVLLLKWELPPQTGPGPLGVRWIAEAVPGVEKNHVIAMSKSDADKREGEFSLKKPTAGFPPGQYRVEVWQTGKMIYSEKFEIKGD